MGGCGGQTDRQTWRQAHMHKGRQMAAETDRQIDR